VPTCCWPRSPEAFRLPAGGVRATRETPLASNQASTRQTLVFDDNRAAAELYGEGERSLKVLEQELEITAHARGNEVRLSGAEQGVRVARKVLQELYAQVRLGNAVHARDVREAVRMATHAPDADLADICENVLAAVGSRRRIAAKNLSQRRYIELMRDRDLVIAVGPAGTGKTYLAMAMAVAALHRHEVSRIILTRPAVEAGEKLGFLPGTMAEKVNPYLRPLYDALHDMMSFDKAARLMDRGAIEVAPLAFMRGRTLNDSFVILDEAQNSTSEQMKMFLTRLRRSTFRATSRAGWWRWPGSSTGSRASASCDSPSRTSCAILWFSRSCAPTTGRIAGAAKLATPSPKPRDEGPDLRAPASS
jgi:phosphate starvation-inducible PhoH-like protein